MEKIAADQVLAEMSLHPVRDYSGLVLVAIRSDHYCIEMYGVICIG